MRLIAIVFLLLYALPGVAHEVRPGYLELTETAPERYQVLWKVPMKGDAVLRMSPLFPETCMEQAPPSRRAVSSAMVKQLTIVCADWIKVAEISIDGLNHTMSDLLVRVTHS